MADRRLEKVNELLKREIGSILLREFSDNSCLITINEVKTAGNLQSAQVLFSVIPSKKTEQISRFLNRQVFEIQQRLNRHLRMRPVPKIIFKADDSVADLARTIDIINHLPE